MTPDGRRLRLADPHDPAGQEFTVEIDARLRAALGVQPATRPENPVPKVETQMDSMLRPRDIQARIRAGETPESVAAAAQDHRREGHALRRPGARRARARRRARPAVLDPPPRRRGRRTARRTLGEAITGHLHERNVDPEVVAWDAWRREDGRWALTGRFSIQGRDGLAELTFDQPGNFVVLDNDDARWLVGDVPDPVAEPEPEPGVRRLAAVPAEDTDQLTLGDDVLGITDEPIEAFLDDEPGRRRERAGRGGRRRGGARRGRSTRSPDEDPAQEPPRRPVKKTRGRASVPSWDEIMFGGGKPE